MTRIGVIGAGGRMGREILRAVAQDPELALQAAAGRRDAGRLVSELAPEADTDLVVMPELSPVGLDVAVDVAIAEGARDRAIGLLAQGVSVVIGATGLSDADLAAIDQTCQGTGVPAMYVPNFSIGACLMMRFAESAARWMPDAEIIEMHHEQKRDAPSGTAMLTAERIAHARRQPATVPETLRLKAEGARGGAVDGIPVHAVRLPGFLAHQSVIFGATGEVLTIRHDATDRRVYMPGVVLCVKSVRQLRGLTIGMDPILFPPRPQE